MNEGLYELPAGWRWVRLGEVTTFIKSGFAFSKKNGIKGDVLHLRPYNIGDDGQIKLEQQFFIPKSRLSADWSPLEPGDVLFNNTNSVELVGKTALVKSELPAAYSNHLTRICVKRNMCEGGWLALVLNVLWHEGFFAKQCNKWIGQAGFNTEALGKLLIPLPLIEEQRRIVSRIEELMERVREARRLRQKALKDTERLWQSVLSEIFPRPGTELPAGWRWATLREVSSVYSGSAAPQGKEYFKDGHFPFVRVQDLARYKLTTFLVETSDSINEEAIKNLRLIKAKAGTILFPKSGAAILTNSRAILGREAYIVSHLAAIYPNQNHLDSLWAFYWLCTVDMSDYVDNPAYPSLRLSKIKELSIPLPPIREQKRIVSYLQIVYDRVKRLKEMQGRTAEKLRLFEQSILDCAFRGDL